MTDTSKITVAVVVRRKVFQATVQAALSYPEVTPC